MQKQILGKTWSSIPSIKGLGFAEKQITNEVEVDRRQLTFGYGKAYYLKVRDTVGAMV